MKFEASALVVVAERRLDEFRAIARYLNDCADALGVTGVRVLDIGPATATRRFVLARSGSIR